MLSGPRFCIGTKTKSTLAWWAAFISPGWLTENPHITQHSNCMRLHQHLNNTESGRCQQALWSPWMFAELPWACNSWQPTLIHREASPICLHVQHRKWLLWIALWLLYHGWPLTGSGWPESTRQASPKGSKAHIHGVGLQITAETQIAPQAVHTNSSLSRHQKPLRKVQLQWLIFPYTNQ